MKTLLYILSITATILFTLNFALPYAYYSAYSAYGYDKFESTDLSKKENQILNSFSVINNNKYKTEEFDISYLKDSCDKLTIEQANSSIDFKCEINNQKNISFTSEIFQNNTSFYLPRNDIESFKYQIENNIGTLYLDREDFTMSTENYINNININKISGLIYAEQRIKRILGRRLNKENYQKQINS
jgi:hypothetical protein